MSEKTEVGSKKAKRLANKLRKAQAALTLLQSDNPTIDVSISYSALETLIRCGKLLQTSSASAEMSRDWKGGVGGTLEKLQAEFHRTRKDVNKAKEHKESVRIQLKLEKLRGRCLCASDLQSLTLYSILGSGTLQKPKWLKLEKLRGRCLCASDLQSLTLYSILGSGTLQKPKWVNLKPWRLLSQSLTIVVELGNPEELMRRQIGTSIIGFIQDKFPFIRKFFTDRAVVGRVSSLEVFYQDLFQVWMSAAAVIRERLAEERRLAGREGREEPIRGRSANVTDLLLSSSDMIDFGYPLPLDLDCSNSSLEEGDDEDDQGEGFDSEEFVFTKPAYTKVTPESPVFAVDCEMCLVGKSGRQTLTRLSILDADCRVVLDTLVRPRARISDYVHPLLVTRYSGITPAMMDSCSVRLEDVQKILQRILPADAVLVGHSLNFDLRAMRMYHPFVVDLSVAYNLSGSRHSKTSLQTLTSTFLGHSVQGSKFGHCSVEDSWATMKLFLRKMEESVEFGNVELGWVYASLESPSLSSLRAAERLHASSLRLAQATRLMGVADSLQSLQKRPRSPSPCPILAQGAEPTRDPSTSPPPAKKKRTRRRKSAVRAEEPVAQCEGCSATMSYPACRTSSCICRRSHHVSCPSCNLRLGFVADEKASTSSQPTIPNGDTVLDWNAAVGLGTLAGTSGRSDSLRHVLDREDKSLLLAGTSQSFYQAAYDYAGFERGSEEERRGGKKPVVQRLLHPAEGVEPGQWFRERMLESEVGVLQLDLDLPSGEEGESAVEALDLLCLALDDCVSAIAHSAPPRAMLSLLFLPKDGGAKGIDPVVSFRVK